MFSSFKSRLLLGIYIFILLSIPVGAYLASQYQTIQSRASEKKVPKALPPVIPKTATPSAKQLLNSAALSQGVTQTVPSPSPEPSSPSVATSYGPTLSLKASLEGRPEGKQTTKLFVGIMEGALTANPKFLLSFTIDLPASGVYSDLSLAGLTPGLNYTALLKGSAQIASSVAFTMSPAITNLNDGAAVNLNSGDLNDDNVINSLDYSLVQKALGATASSSNWNENIDLNKDGIVNTLDLAIVSKNIGQVGASGVWTSPAPKTATPSAGAASPPMGSPDGSDGYWLWLPK